MPPIHDFLTELDRLWDLPVEGRIRLHLIGSTALMLQADYLHGTKDTDVLETADMNATTRAGSRCSLDRERACTGATACTSRSSAAGSPSCRKLRSGSAWSS